MAMSGERSAPPAAAGIAGRSRRTAHTSACGMRSAQKKRMRSGGQASPNARPSIWLRRTEPQMRESSESLRLSPMTK